MYLYLLGEFISTKVVEKLISSQTVLQQFERGIYLPFIHWDTESFSGLFTPTSFYEMFSIFTDMFHIMICSRLLQLHVQLLWKPQ